MLVQPIASVKQVDKCIYLEMSIFSFKQQYLTHSKLDCSYHYTMRSRGITILLTVTHQWWEQLLWWQMKSKNIYHL